jgi:hypothetical protein
VSGYASTSSVLCIGSLPQCSVLSHTLTLSHCHTVTHMHTSTRVCSLSLSLSHSCTIATHTPTRTGMVGAILFGGLTDHFRRYREILIGCFCMAVVFMFLLALAFQLEWGFAAITTLFGLIGFFALALLPVSMEAAVEVTYPAPEAVVTSFILLFGNIWAYVFFLRERESCFWAFACIHERERQRDRETERPRERNHCL